MARTKKGSELSLSGTSLASRFAITMTIALAVVMIIAGAFLYNRMVSAAQAVQEKTFIEATRLQGPLLEQMREDQQAEIDLKVYGKKSDPDKKRIENPIADPNVPPTAFAEGEVKRFNVMYGENRRTPGHMYLYKDIMPPLLVPMTAKDTAGEGLMTIIVGVTLFVILAGALVAYVVGTAVSRPLEIIVDDIAQISRGDLRHRTRVRAGGEVMLLAKSIDRMAGNLEQAQEAQLELNVREREIALAGDVREALLPQTTPAVLGYELASLHVDSPTPGGDFHEFIELADGRIGLLVCDVSGRGIPGAMIGAIARSYLRVELSSGGDVAEAFHRVNAEIARDVRRGMYVTALYVLVDPKDGIATVACAGHKIPLIRFTAADKKIRLVQTEGIALGFDKGPVFKRTLQVQKIPFDPGDHIVISNSGPALVKNGEGKDLGDKEFYRYVLQHAGLGSKGLSEALGKDLANYADSTPFPSDISIVCMRRKA